LSIKIKGAFNEPFEIPGFIGISSFDGVAVRI
jgi:hypothetical protein